jgi:hypothetical protein
MKRNQCLTVFLAMAIYASSALAQSDRLEAARRHMVRGGAAVEMAIANKSPGDLQDAAREFRKATELAPEMALAWFNLGSVEAKLGRYAEAIAAYQRYLKLNPKAEDAQKVQDDIIKLEYQQERTAKRDKLVGNWTVKLPLSYAPGQFATDTYKVTMTGSEFRMEPLSNYHWLSREFRLFTPDLLKGGKLVPLRAAKIDNPRMAFIGRLEGEKVVGERIRPGFYDAESKCRVNDHRAPFEGRFEDNGEALVLSFEEPRYRAVWEYKSYFSSSGETECLRLETDPPERMEQRFTPDRFGVGFELAPRVEGGGSWLVGTVSSGYSANFMGVLPGDRILAIEGQDTAVMSETALKGKLWNRQGQTVRVLLNRDGWTAPVELTLVCGVVPWPYGKPFGNGRVGIELGYDLLSKSGTPAWRYHINGLVEGSAAVAAGVRPGGDIVAVDGKEITQLPYLHAVGLMRGDPGTEVKLAVQYPDGSKVDYSLIRQEEKPKGK